MGFAADVYEIVKTIPKGRVTSYGHVALLAGRPRGAQLVGWMLAQSHDAKVPWQRVINKQGIISINNPEHPQSEQARLLELEGVLVEQRDEAYHVDMEKYGWFPS